jgi:hypothetical protein
LVAASAATSARDFREDLRQGFDSALRPSRGQLTRNDIARTIND